MLIVCISIGVVSGLELLPLVYPFYAGQANFIGIPENRGVGLFFWIREVMLFMDVVNMFQTFMATSPLITLILVVLSIIGGSIGLIIGIRRFPGQTDDKWLE
jgi:hypothetical protein